MSDFKEVHNRQILFKGKNFFIIKDRFPVSPSHLLIISNEVKRDYFDLSNEERQELAELIVEARRIIEKERSPSGYNIGMNCGKSAGQIVMHFHCHVIPRYDGDTKDPHGGIRNCIQGNGPY
jgi:diadenosine tetraphosphate (Ap4A) HIT family hydrolase